MKTIYLIRHGKSDWHHNIADIDRALNTRGVKDCKTMGKIIKQAKTPPQLMFYSSSKRTEQTTLLLAKQLQDHEIQLIKCPELYLCRREAIYDIIHFAPEHIDSMAIVAHNPSISNVAAELGNDRALCMPSLAIVQLTFDTTRWEDVSSHNCSENLFFVPNKNK